MTRIHHIAISVKDAITSANFYKGHFGFKEIQKYTKPGWHGSATILELGNVRLEIFQFNDAAANKDNLSDLKVIGLKHIGIQVANVREKFKELQEKGVDIETPSQGVTCSWFCFLRDPDGISIELYEP